MIILQIEHKVPSFETWKKAFDNDPVGRKKSGVRKYQVCRPANDAGYVIVDLYFDTADKAEKMHLALQALWGKVEGSVMTGPKARILNVVESEEL